MSTASKGIVGRHSLSEGILLPDETLSGSLLVSSSSTGSEHPKLNGSVSMGTSPSTVTERDIAEIRRSAEEARDFVRTSVDPTQVDRYSAPPADATYSLEYAFYLLGDVRGKTVVDLGCGHG